MPLPTLTTTPAAPSLCLLCLLCSSLAFQPPAELEVTLKVVREAGVTVVSLPLVNQWTQDRSRLSQECGRTPRWRGITLLHELRQVGGCLALLTWHVIDAMD